LRGRASFFDLFLETGIFGVGVLAAIVVVGPGDRLDRNLPYPCGGDTRRGGRGIRPRGAGWDGKDYDEFYHRF
jgi:hypothetical protein